MGHGGGIEVEDLGSRNGTRVNGAEIQSRHPLQEGDIVEIGNVELRVEACAGARARGPADACPSTAVQSGRCRKAVGALSGPWSSATLIALGTIAGTAVALIAYFVDRGL